MKPKRIHAFETEIFEPSYMVFSLHSSALGYDENFIIEISCDYGDSEDGMQHIVNVWAREKKTAIKSFLKTEFVAKGGDAATAIFQALNMDEDFRDVLSSYIDFVVLPSLKK